MFIAIYTARIFSMSDLSPVLVGILTAFYQSTSLTLLAKEPAVPSINTELFYTFENPSLRMDRMDGFR